MAEHGIVYAVCDGERRDAIKIGYTQQDAAKYVRGYRRTYNDVQVLQLLSTAFPKLAESYITYDDCGTASGGEHATSE